MGSYLLAACDNIQKGHYISLKQLTNWLVTLFIMSHTCDKLFNSVTPNKSKSKQLANAVWGLFVAIYRCSQAVTALQSAIRGGNLLMTHLIWQAIHSTHGSDEIGSRFCYLKLLRLSPTAAYMFAVCTSLLQVVQAGNVKREALCSYATEQELCSVGMSSGLQETWTAVWLLTRRDTTGKICWLHIISSSPLEWTEPRRSWSPFPVSWDYFLS